MYCLTASAPSIGALGHTVKFGVHENLNTYSEENAEHL